MLHINCRRIIAPKGIGILEPGARIELPFTEHVGNEPLFGSMQTESYVSERLFMVVLHHDLGRDNDVFSNYF